MNVCDRRKRALITGISGQDGSYLSELLLDEGYEVHGIVRRQSVAESQTERLWHIEDNERFHTYYGDVTDVESIYAALRASEPDEVYNLAAQSHVRVSFDKPQYTAMVNAIGALNMLQASWNFNRDVRYYSAASSEMFGNMVSTDGATEETPMRPVSPYGIAKLFAYNMTRTFRDRGMFAANGILFNHCSARRGRNFVEAKIVDGLVRRRFLSGPQLRLGNLSAVRDWGHSRDYVRAMHMILQADKPDDYVVGTGKVFSVRDMTVWVCNILGLDWKDSIVLDDRHTRPVELYYLKANASKIWSKLGWAPTYAMPSILFEMLKVRGDELGIGEQVKACLSEGKL